MSFDFRSFLEQHNIEYITQGSNVAQGNINIRCPFCRASDPSHHLGIRIEDGIWGCWRDARHRGRRPHLLIMELLNCSYAEASTISGITGPELSKFDEVVAAFGQEQERERGRSALSIPEEFQSLETGGMADRFYSYLIYERGFHKADILDLAYEYDLKYCLVGYWKDRIIIPIYMADGLVTWTSRALHSQSKERYKTLPTEESVMNIKHVVFNYPELIAEGGETLFITEGVFDAMKVDFYGKTEGIRATCLFSSSVLLEQVWLLNELVPQFSQTYILLDATEVSGALQVQAELSSLPVNVRQLPPGVADPADLSPSQVRALV